MMEEKKKVVLAEPLEGDAYSPRPNRKPDISRRAKLEGWHEEGIYVVSSVVQRPELKRERIIDQKSFKVSKTAGDKSSLCLSMSVDSEAADPYGQMIEKVVRELGPKAHKPVKFQASGLVFQDGERLKVYHSKKAQEIRCVICLDASQSKYKVFAEVSDLMSKIYKTIESIK